MRTKLSLALVALFLIPAACGTARDSVADAPTSGAAMQRTLVEYNLVYNDTVGKVGYMKAYLVSHAGEPAKVFRYIYDLDFNEVGFFDGRGNAWAYDRYPPHEAEIHGVPLRNREMQGDTVGRNALRMLGMNPNIGGVSFPAAAEADILSDG